MSYLQIKNLTKAFGETQVLCGIDLSVERGEFVSLLGPSGCGKTTMLRIIAGFAEPSSGEITIDGRLICSPEQKISLPSGQRRLGMVFQSYAVWPHMNLLENVAYPLKIQKVKAEERNRRAMEMLARVGLGGREKEYSWALSGGQQQRIALARALVMEPSVLLLDEPLSNLDAHLRERMKEEIRDIQRQMRITVIYVTHDQAEAMQMSDRVVILNRGKVEQQASPREIYFSPRTAFVAGFVGKNNIFEWNGVQTAVRPEAVFLSKQKPNEGHCMQGILQRAVFEGSRTVCIFETELGEIVAEAPADFCQKEGDALWLGWKHENQFPDHGKRETVDE